MTAAALVSECRRTSASPSARPSGETQIGIHPSPSSPARRRAASDFPPTQSGGPPGWTGCGSIVTPSNEKNRPENDESGPEKSSRNARIASSARAPRSRGSTPTASKSLPPSPPTPTPSTVRPPERKSSDANSRATSDG